MNSPNYPPPGGPQGPYGQPQDQPFGQRPPQTPPGGQPYGGPPPQGPPYGAPPPQGPPYGAPPPQGPPPGGFGPGPGGPGGFGGPGAPGPGAPGPGGPAAGGFGPPGGPGGAPPAAYPTPPPPAPTGKPKMSTFTKIKIGLGVVVVAAGAVFGIMNWGTSAASAEVGDCIKVNDGSATDADIEKIDCTSPDAVYKVAVTLDNSSGTCPEGDYTSYSQGGRRTADVTLCLMLNAKEGDCFKVSDANDDVTRTDCATADAQVTKVLDGATDDSGCPEGTAIAQKYPEPKPVVMCLGAPAGASGT